MFSLIFTHFTKLAAIIIHKWFIVFLLKMLEGCNKGLLKRCTIYFTPLHRLYHWWLLQSYGRDIQISKQDFRSEPIQNLTKSFQECQIQRDLFFLWQIKRTAKQKKCKVIVDRKFQKNWICTKNDKHAKCVATQFVWKPWNCSQNQFGVQFTSCVQKVQERNYVS